MKEEYSKDTYFFNAQVALKIAKQNNKMETIKDHPVKALQICYYAGEVSLQNAPKNCIHVPLENTYNYFVKTENRFPKHMNFDDTGFSKDEMNTINNAIGEVFKEALTERYNLTKLYIEQVKNNTPNFKEKKWRIFIPTIRESTVLKHVSKNITATFKELGFEVFYYISDELGEQNLLPKLYYLDKFNPHIIINLDFLENQYLNDSVYNFCWFQDPVAILYNEEEIKIRKRDFILSLFDEYKNALIKKGVNKDKIYEQPFCTNPLVFFKNKTIKKEEKIVFLGSDYNFEKTYNLSEECLRKLDFYIEENDLNINTLKEISAEFNINYKALEIHILPSLVRRKVVIWLCSLDNIKVEIFGTEEWLKTPEVKPFYKGLLPYGEEMAKVYNSAKYAIAAHSQYKYQQRVIEMSACGTIPIIYHCDLITENFYHMENVLLFSTSKELEKCINKEPKKDPIEISDDISYKHMARKIISIVKENIKD